MLYVKGPGRRFQVAGWEHHAGWATRSTRRGVVDTHACPTGWTHASAGDRLAAFIPAPPQYNDREAGEWAYRLAGRLNAAS